MAFDIEKLRAKGFDEASIAICQRMNENNAKREACTFHEFGLKYVTKFVCKNCGYEADATYVRGYHDGLKHCGGE